MRALILAAGFGTRLGPSGRDRPKVLLPVDPSALSYVPSFLIRGLDTLQLRFGYRA